MSTTASASGWQLAEGSAVAYERLLVPLLFDRWAGDLVDAVALQPAEAVLDVACGTGVVARHAAARVGVQGSVTGVDLNPAMLAVARASVPTGAGADIRWEEGDAAALPLDDEEVDVTLCQQALQFFPQRSRALDEMRRVTRSGGRLGLSTCRGLAHQPGYRILADVIGEHVSDAASEALRSPFTYGEIEEVRRLVEDAGFADVHVRVAVWSLRFASPEAFLRTETASSPLGDVVARLDGAVVDGLIADLAERLRPHRDDEGVVFPFETCVVTATRP